ncbi:TPA: hypothetical protein ACSP84_003395 [Aeromonas veronii]
MKLKLTLNPEKGLEEQPLFWVAIISPLILALTLGTPVWIDYSLSFNELAYSKFLEISKLPIGLCSLAIPFGVLVGKLHGAKQTAIQIQNTKRQILNTEQDNRTKLYLSHFEHFSKHIDLIEASLIRRYSKILDENTTTIVNKLALYKEIYPENSIIDGLKPISEHFFIFSKNTTNRAHEAYKNLMHTTSNDIDLFVCNLCEVEVSLFNVQVNALKCQQNRISIFRKKFSEDIKLSKKFRVGISIELDDYLEQIKFFINLLDGIESFEILHKENRVSNALLSRLSSNTYVTMPTEKTYSLWNIFNMSYDDKKEMPE